MLPATTCIPTLDVKADGPADRLALDLDVKSEAGNVRGQVTTDLKTPDLAVRGEVDVERLNLAPILKDPAQQSDLTGHAKVDLTIASAPAGAPRHGSAARDVRVQRPAVPPPGL